MFKQLNTKELIEVTGGDLTSLIAGGISTTAVLATLPVTAPSAAIAATGGIAFVAGGAVYEAAERNPRTNYPNPSKTNSIYSNGY